MKNTALDGAYSKIDRAVDHFNKIDIAIGEMFLAEKDTGTAGHEFKANSQELVVSLAEQAPLDPTLPLMVGDCVHNARSVLDHLVYQLALLNKSPKEAAAKTSFPICLTPKEFKNATKGKIAPFVSKTAFTEIERLQPYKTGDNEKDVLWILSQLDIIDKHRLLIVAETQARPTAFKITTPDGRALFAHDTPNSPWKPSKVGAEVIRFSFSGSVPSPTEMKVEVRTAKTVQIQQTGLVCDGMILLEVLRDCVNYTGMTLNHFGQLFFDN
jgi:hypothetical protein